MPSPNTWSTGTRVVGRNTTLEEARCYYMYANSVDGAKRTMKQRLALLEPYLEDKTYQYFLKHSTGDAIQTRAMQKQSPPQQIRFEDWLAPSSQNRNAHPKVSMVNIVKAPAPMGWLRSWIKASGLMTAAWLTTGLAAILTAIILAPMLLLKWVRQCQWNQPTS